MKRCVQCQNDLPDTAVHCVYCGTKQPHAASVAAAGARTVMGHPGVTGDLARQGGPPPPAAPVGKPRAGGVSGFDATQPLANDGFRGPGAPPAQPPRQGYGPPPAFGPPGSHAPQPPLHSYGPPHQQPPLHSYGPAGQPPGPPQGYGPPPGPGFGQPGGSGFGPPGPPQGFGPPEQGFAPPGPPPGYGMPPRQGGGGPGFPPPPSGSGFNPIHAPQMPPGPPPHVYGPPPGFNRPETDIVAPLRGPYNVGPEGRRMPSPLDPWSESLKTLMLVFGVLLVACFVAPWRVQPGQTTFAWTILGSAAPMAIKVGPILFLATGVLAVALGAIPVGPLARGFAAAGVGLAPLVYRSVDPAFDWRTLINLIGAVTLVGGLLVRSQYTGALIGRMMATIGAIGMLLPLLIPMDDSIPLVTAAQVIAEAPFEMKMVGIVNLMPAVFAILALLVWLPPPGRAGSHVLAWLIIVWPFVASIAVWLVGGNLGASLKDRLDGVLYTPLALMAWSALTGYGVATVAGKQLEQM